MNVFFSNRAGKQAVYHQKDCPYEKRIGEHNRIEITVKQAKKGGRHVRSRILLNMYFIIRISGNRGIIGNAT